MVVESVGAKLAVVLGPATAGAVVSLAGGCAALSDAGGNAFTVLAEVYATAGWTGCDRDFDSQRTEMKYGELGQVMQLSGSGYTNTVSSPAMAALCSNTMLDTGGDANAAALLGLLAAAVLDVRSLLLLRDGRYSSSESCPSRLASAE